MSEPPASPLVVLQLVVDRRQSVAALLLRPFPDDVRGLALLLAEGGLAEAMGPLPCLLTLRDPGQLDPETAALLPAGRIELVLPPAFADSPALAPLRAKGFTVSTHALSLEVESRARFDRLKQEGAQRFTGNWYLQPEEKTEAGHPASRVRMLRLLQLIAADADTEELEAVFMQDPNLSYQLLKLVNSVAMGLAVKISSFRHAITILGQRQLKRWLQLLMFVQGQEGGPLSPLLATAVLRARLLELASAALGASRNMQEQAFMVGMFSLLGTLLGVPLENILPPLNLADEVVAALLQRKGQQGRLLRMAELAEGGGGPPLARLLEELGLSAAQFHGALFQASRWMLDSTLEVSGG